MNLHEAIIGIGGTAQKGYLPVLAAWEALETQLLLETMVVRAT